MQEIQPIEFDRLLPFIDQMEYDTLFARMVIEKKQHGQVFVDQKRDPGVVLVSHHCGMALLGGIEKNRDFDPHFFDPLLTKMNHEPKEQWLIIHPKTLEEKWELSLGSRLAKISEIEFDEKAGLEEKVAKVQALSQDHVIGWTRAKFKFQETKFENNQNWREKIPPGFVLKRIDPEEIKRIRGEVIPGHFWDSPDVFLKNGVGFCLVNEGEIISICFSAFIAGSRLEIGIETDERYRGQGFGIITGAALIEYCLEKGLEPVWGCEKENWSSFRLAQKLGFAETLSYPSYSWFR